MTAIDDLTELVERAADAEEVVLRVGQAVAQVPAHREQDHLRREAEPSEAGPRRCCGSATVEA